MRKVLFSNPTLKRGVRTSRSKLGFSPIIFNLTTLGFIGMKNDRNIGFSAKTRPDSASEGQNDSRIHHGGARESRRDSSESNFDTPDSRRNARKHRCRLSGEPF